MKKKPKCIIAATISVVTKQKGAKDRHGRFERRIEDLLQGCYVAYMKHLVAQIPEADKYTWKQINKHTLQLVTMGAI